MCCALILTSLDGIFHVEIVHDHFPKTWEHLLIAQAWLHWTILATLSAIVKGVWEERSLDTQSGWARAVVLVLFSDQSLTMGNAASESNVVYHHLVDYRDSQIASSL